MLNIEIQCCGLLILAVIAFFYFRLPKLKVKSKWTFFALLIAGILCTVCDILSVVAISYAPFLSDAFVKLVAKVYLLFLILTVYAGFLYICSDFCKTDRAFSLNAIVSAAIVAPIIVVMLALPIEYVCEGGGAVVYTYGPSTLVAYAGAAITFVAMLVFLILGRFTMERRRNVSVLLWLVIWVVAAVVQYFVPSLLIVSFAASVGILMIFMMIENPGQTLDKGSQFFHDIAMEQYFVERYINDKKFSVIMTAYVPADIPFYKSLPKRYTFVGDGNIYFVFKYVEQMRSCLEALSAHVANEKIYVVENSRVVNSAKDLLGALRGAKIMFNNEDEKICTVDESVIRVFDEARATRRILEEAMEKDRVEVFYQPIYSVADKKFSTAEALVRIRDGEGNLISPVKFIPVAERDGTIIRLGKIIFDKACRFINGLDASALGLKYVEVNLSVVQAESKQLVEEVTQIMKLYGIPSSLINFEITESASVQGRKRLLENMNSLIEAGISFSLDDFGTGQSNLDYMAAMPVKIVKFDRSMTQSYFESEKTRFIMNAAISMIHDLGLKVVVEGIENKEQLDKMISLGVEHIQGFYFSKPIPENEFIEFLKKNNL